MASLAARSAKRYLNALWVSGFSRLGLNRSAEGTILVARNWAFRVLLLTAGAVAITSGIVMTIVAGVGVGPADVFITGVANVSSLSLGVSAYAYVAIVLLGLLIVRRKPSVGGMALSVMVSGLFFVIPGLIPAPESLIGSWTYLFVGLGLLVVGVEMAVAAGLGRGHIEILVEEVAIRTGWSERAVRTVSELSLLTAGLSLGGQAGPGTVVVAVSVGPLLQGLSRVISDYQTGRSLRLSTSHVCTSSQDSSHA